LPGAAWDGRHARRLATRRSLAPRLQSPVVVVEKKNDTKRRMIMIRNMLFGISLLTLSGTAAFAAPAVKHSTKARVVAQADAPAPAGDKAAAPAAKKEKKHTKKVKTDAAKVETKTEGGKDMKAAPAPETK
jgi:hypothetical protein